MLKVDLGQLKVADRLRIDARVPADHPMWRAGPDLVDGLEVHLEARRSGDDVVVRGEIAGTVEAACRRCLETTRASFDEPVLLVYRPAGGETVGDDEVYEVPARAHEIDLEPAIRESTLLAAPEYVLCRSDCAGLCPHCGVDLNRMQCNCAAGSMDQRWAALKRLRPDG
jgi:uncharacterized protein